MRAWDRHASGWKKPVEYFVRDGKLTLDPDRVELVQQPLIVARSLKRPYTPAWYGSLVSSSLRNDIVTLEVHHASYHPLHTSRSGQPLHGGQCPAHLIGWEKLRR